ncbi:MAG: 23S rRNA (adenine(2503)-C(2))-methyltransferase RlmN [Acidobacteria bacterium]|nr:23S rRNA (adenine(2503)-C(2))-methyltransferase RlmN [Acidobacteriota bacterium]
MTTNIVGMDLAEMKAMLGPALPAFRSRQLYEAVYKNRVSSIDDISNFPKDLRASLGQSHSLALPEVQSRFDSVDGTQRYLLKLEDGKTVETVLMPEGERYTFCISSQVGCPVNCQFCLTALMGLERNLSAGEIVGQILKVAALNGLETSIDRLNIVMMGQGEPLLNLPNVIRATRILLDENGVGFSPRRVTVSTSGILPKMLELAKEPVRPKLAISLNASNEEQRQEIVPITRKYHLKDLMEVCRNYPLRSWEKLTFEYVLLKDVNDTDADARRVAKLVSNINCKVNLIALNPGPGIAFETPTPERVHNFQEIVQRAVPCFVRRPRGLDVYAACGQLKRMELTQISERPGTSA